MRCDYCSREILHPADVEWLAEWDTGEIIDLRITCHFGSGVLGPDKPGCSNWIRNGVGGPGSHFGYFDFPIPEKNQRGWWFSILEEWTREDRRGLIHWAKFGRELFGLTE